MQAPGGCVGAEPLSADGTAGRGWVTERRRLLFWRRDRGGVAQALCTCLSRKIQGGALLSSVLCNLKEDEVVQPSGSPRSPPCFSSEMARFLQFRQKICPSDIFATRTGRRALLPATHTMQQSIASNRAAILGAPVRARTAAPARRVASLAPVAASRCAPPRSDPRRTA